VTVAGLTLMQMLDWALAQSESRIGFESIAGSRRVAGAEIAAGLQFYDVSVNQDVLSVECLLKLTVDEVRETARATVSPLPSYTPNAGERWEYSELLVSGIRRLNMLGTGGASWFQPETGRIVTHAVLHYRQHHMAAAEERMTVSLVQRDLTLNWLADLLATGREAAALVARLAGEQLQHLYRDP
jgi:hypothetical protein